jgi:hypothetical protein
MTASLVYAVAVPGGSCSDDDLETEHAGLEMTNGLHVLFLSLTHSL